MTRSGTNQTLQRKASRSNGPRRSRYTHAAILTAAESLLISKGYAAVTIESIAAEAGAGKQTIYRWWSSKAALYSEIYANLAGEHIELPNEGSVEEDLVHLITDVFQLFNNTIAGQILAGLIAESQSNPDVATALREGLISRRREFMRAILARGVERGELLPDTNLDFVLDVMSGAVWYRLLLGHAPLDINFAKQIVRVLMDGTGSR